MPFKRHTRKDISCCAAILPTQISSLTKFKTDKNIRTNDRGSFVFSALVELHDKPHLKIMCLGFSV